MLEAIRTVFTSAVYPDIRAPEFGGRAIVRSECESESANAGGMIYASIPLSRRERDVIRCYLQGMTVTEIAAKFNRSVKTISTQKVTAFRKLGVSSYAELFRLQEARGLI
jgi:DNA-binding NarL/FixJ family response regulator